MLGLDGIWQFELDRPSAETFREYAAEELEPAAGRIVSRAGKVAAQRA
jgi:hypothetical protein